MIYTVCHPLLGLGTFIFNYFFCHICCCMLFHCLLQSEKGAAPKANHLIDYVMGTHMSSGFDVFTSVLMTDYSWLAKELQVLESAPLILCTLVILILYCLILKCVVLRTLFLSSNSICGISQVCFVILQHFRVHITKAVLFANIVGK